MLRVTALAALAALAGCGAIHDSCAGGTVLAALTLSDTTAQADELVIDVALDDGAPRETSLAHTPGSATGNVVVQFPSGYPRGHKVVVAVTARAAGVVLGDGSASVVLSDGCEAVPLAVTPTGAADLGSPDDLADGGVSDGGSADLAKCVPQTENCFNGTDDDCDGLVDCADPDCTTLAVCVPPVTAPFVVGSTLDDPKSLCPTSYTQLEVVNSGPIDNGCINSTCSCAMVCHTELGYFGNMSNCPNTDNENQRADLNNEACASWNIWDGTMDVHLLVTPMMCTASGTSTVSMPQWATSKEFCSTALHGGGCSGGDWCVPATPGAKCEVAAGAHTCDAGYNAVSGTWYTGFSDFRACGCTCGAATGNCGTTVTLYSDKSCTMNAASFAATGTNNISCNVTGPYLSGKINVSPTTGACAAGGGATESGTLGGMGQQTLCCAP